MDRLTCTDAKRERILRLLGPVDEIPAASISRMRRGGRVYVALDDLDNWLTQLSGKMASGQKQEAVEGIREYLDVFAQ